LHKNKQKQKLLLLLNPLLPKQHSKLLILLQTLLQMLLMKLPMPLLLELA
jgi:hypothetical protein